MDLGRKDAVSAHVPKLVRVLGGEVISPPPVWMMRQAGRHLPEYLKLRAEARDFLHFCYSPDLAAEATLQPVRRYGMDAAILFADILLVLDAMGLNVVFEKGEGPLIEKIGSPADLDRKTLSEAKAHLAPVSETVRRVRAALPRETALIGFAGAPWTVTLYAIEGRGKTDRSDAVRWAYRRPEDLNAAMERVIEVTAHYLKAQADAGADALMLFDSWAEGLSAPVFEAVIIAPTRKLVARLRALGVTQPVIGFPRGAGAMLAHYAQETGVQALGLDTAAVPDFVNAALPATLPVQGHLDPLLLIEGGAALDRQVRALLKAYAHRPYIFNLGHGIRPETPIQHVERVLSLIRSA
jgi:uroporphyrinogen decarboxylase